MAKDAPTFLQNIGDDPESQDLLTALDGEPENEEPTEETKPDEEVATEDKPVEKEADTVDEEPKSDDEEKKDETEEGAEKEVDKDGDNTTETEPPKTDKPEVKKEEPKVFGKYKDLTEAEKGYKELESAFGRVNAMLEGYKSGKIPANIPEGSAQLMKMAETPMVKFAKPNVSDYTDADGMLNVDAYMGEYTKNLIVGIQKSMLMGPLAAAQFGILQEAMKEESTSRVTAQQKEVETEEITNKLYTQFPILKTDKDIEETISNTIIGAKTMRQNQAKAEGKEMIPFTYDDYEKIIISVLRNSPSLNDKEIPDKVENIRSGVTFNGGKKATNEMDDIISGMESVTDKRSIF